MLTFNTRHVLAAAAICLLNALIPAKASAREIQDMNIEDFGLKHTKQISLTFDDGPGKGTAKILDLLKRYGIKATFFVVGEQAKRNPDLMARIAAEGHILSSHSYRHDNLSQAMYAYDPMLLLKDLKDTNDVIKPYLTGKTRLYFRAPYGAWQFNVSEKLNQDPELRQYVGPIYWNVGKGLERDENGKLTNAGDWACWRKGAKGVSMDECVEGYLAKFESEGGGVALMHDIHTNTADMVEIMLPILIERGYRFITLDEISMLDLYRGSMRPVRMENGTPVNF